MLAIKGFTKKKTWVVLNDDELRPVPMPKDFAHLMIRKIDDAYIEFIHNGSDANAHVDMSEYTLQSKFPQVKHLIRTLRGVIFQSSFNCCSLLECLYSKIPASNAPRCGAKRKRIVRQMNSEDNERLHVTLPESINIVQKMHNSDALNEPLRPLEKETVVQMIMNSEIMKEQQQLPEKESVVW